MEERLLSSPLGPRVVGPSWILQRARGVGRKRKPRPRKGRERIREARRLRAFLGTSRPLLDCSECIYLWNTCGIWRFGITGWVFFLTIVVWFVCALVVLRWRYIFVLVFKFCLLFFYRGVLCVTSIARSIHNQILFTCAVALGFVRLVLGFWLSQAISRAPK